MRSIVRRRASSEPTDRATAAEASFPLPGQASFYQHPELGAFCGIQVRPDTDIPDTLPEKEMSVSECPVRPPLNPPDKYRTLSANVRMSGKEGCQKENKNLPLERPLLETAKRVHRFFIRNESSPLFRFWPFPSHASAAQ
jgi:hypothetical protein